jgi:hypothetical protein
MFTGLFTGFFVELVTDSSNLPTLCSQALIPKRFNLKG